MIKQSLALIILLALNIHVHAQEDLFGKEEKAKIRKGWILSVTGDFDIPGGDMAKRFGVSDRAGGGVYYKTDKNWIFGAKVDFIFGNKIKEDSLMINLKDKYGDFLASNGNRIGVPTYERGYMLAVEAGKIISLSHRIPDNGLLCLTSVGFMQHKIDIYDANDDVPGLRGDYLKGYDRLTNGMFVEEYVAYVYFSKNHIINFNIGLDATFGFTQGRRDYLFDVMHPDNQQRLDILFGIRGGWYIPIFKRKSEEVFY